MNRQNHPHKCLRIHIERPPSPQMTIEQRIANLEQISHHQDQELATLRNQVSFLSQIVADVHETCNVLVKRAVSSSIQPEVNCAQQDQFVVLTSDDSQEEAAPPQVQVQVQAPVPPSAPAPAQGQGHIHVRKIKAPQHTANKRRSAGI